VMKVLLWISSKRLTVAEIEVQEPSDFILR
jgi:hypothetical protein